MNVSKIQAILKTYRSLPDFELNHDLDLSAHRKKNSTTPDTDFEHELEHALQDLENQNSLNPLDS